MLEHNEAFPGEGEAGQSADDPAPEPTALDEPPQETHDAPDDHQRLTITDADQRVSADDAQWLTRAANDALNVILGSAGAQPHDVRLALVGDDEMAALHERHKQIEGTTDVLTFDLREDPQGPLDVDIVACVDEAQRQADSHNIDLKRELLLYFLHGLLHCLGYDDHDDASFAAMHAREDEVLTAIGVGATFAPAGDTEDAR